MKNSNEKQIIYSYFDHPQSVCLSYFEHCMFSLKLSYNFFNAGFKAIIHAFIPNLYITSSSNTVDYLKKEMSKIGCR